VIDVLQKKYFKCQVYMCIPVKYRKIGFSLQKYFAKSILKNYFLIFKILSNSIFKITEYNIAKNLKI